MSQFLYIYHVMVAIRITSTYAKMHTTICFHCLNSNIYILKEKKKSSLLCLRRHLLFPLVFLPYWISSCSLVYSSAWRFSCSISGSADPQILRFLSSENVVVSSLSVKDLFTEVASSPGALTMLLFCVPAARVSDERSAVPGITAPSFLQLLLRLSLEVRSLVVCLRCISGISFVLILLLIHWASWICKICHQI